MDIIEKDQKFGLLLKQFSEIPKLERNTNYFQITGHAHYENMISNVLKYFLNPFEDHGFENLVLKSLLEISVNEFTIGGYGAVEIKREEVTTTKSNRIDLIIETENYIITIENKIYHVLKNDLLDYKEHVLAKYAKHKDEKIFIFLVLSPKGLKRQDEKDILKNSEFKEITYVQLIAQIKKNYNSYAFTAKVKYLIFFNEFISSLENITGTNMKDEKLRDFFLDNTDGLEELTKSYNAFKTNHVKKKLLELRGNIDEQQIIHLSDSGIWENCVLWYEFKLNGHKLYIEAVANMKFIYLRGKGKNIESKEFMLSDEFYEITGIDKDNTEKLEEGAAFKIIYDEENESYDLMVEALKTTLDKMNSGCDKINQ